jgi:hypothetical protein
MYKRENSDDKKEMKLYTLFNVWGSISRKLDVSVGLCITGMYGALAMKTEQYWFFYLSRVILLRRRLFQSIELKNRWFLKSSNPFFPRRLSTEQRSCCNKSFAPFDTTTSSGNESGIYTNKQKYIPIIHLKLSH